MIKQFCTNNNYTILIVQPCTNNNYTIYDRAALYKQ